MNDKFEKMRGHKRPLSEHEKKAKMDVVSHLRDMAAHAMKGKLDGMKKVSVASNSEQGLEHGLDKAKQILTHGQEEGMMEGAENPYHDHKTAQLEHMSDEGEGMPEHEASESPEFEKQEQEGDEDMSGDMHKHEHGFADGGEIQDPPDQGQYEAEEPMLNKNHGETDLSPDQGDYSAEGEYDEEMPDQELEDKLQKLMDMKRKRMGKI